MNHDARAICGPRHARGSYSFEGKEQIAELGGGDCGDSVDKWAMNQMLSTSRRASSPVRFDCPRATFRRL